MNACKNEKAVVLIQCPDQKGIIAQISGFVFEHGGNIIQSDQYTTDSENGRFFMRLEFCFDTGFVSSVQWEQEFGILAKKLDAQWTIHYSRTIPSMGILVSQHDHCLFDILYRWHSGELAVTIPCIISNHQNSRYIAERYGIPFYYLPVDAKNKVQQEERILDMLGTTTDFTILARYMQILSEHFLTAYSKDVINIHHSFLPSFMGAQPYKQAYDRGVKIIGATAHYVTARLDEGPIIEQAVERVTHRDNVESMMRKGKNLEKVALANAIRAHIEHRIIRYQNKTIVFDA